MSRASRKRGAALVCALALLTACSSDDPPPPAAGTSPPAAATSSEPSGPEQQVEDVRAAVDDRAEVAQLFVAGVHLDDLASGAELVRSGVGGVFLAGRSQIAAAELAATTAQWQSLSPGPELWMAIDQEGGSVQTLKGPGFDRLPSATEQGALPADQLDALAHGLGTALRDAGLNLNLAPVADVVPSDMEQANEPIGVFDRHNGTTGPEVAAAAGSVMDGMAAAGVTATLKHFPGLGRVHGNTDTSADVVDDVTAADDEEIAAFATLADFPARPFVMTSSAHYRRIDATNPAVFSAAVVTDLLRKRLGSGSASTAWSSPTTWATPAPSATSRWASGRCASSPPAARWCSPCSRRSSRR